MIISIACLMFFSLQSHVLPAIFVQAVIKYLESCFIVRDNNILWYGSKGKPVISRPVPHSLAHYNPLIRQYCPLIKLRILSSLICGSGVFSRLFTQVQHGGATSCEQANE